MDVFWDSVVYLEVLFGDVELVVLMMQMFQLRLESVWLVEQVDGDVETGQYTHGVTDELG